MCFPIKHHTSAGIIMLGVTISSSYPKTQLFLLFFFIINTGLPYSSMRKSFSPYTFFKSLKLFIFFVYFIILNLYDFVKGIVKNGSRYIYPIYSFSLVDRRGRSRNFQTCFFIVFYAFKILRIMEILRLALIDRTKPIIYNVIIAIIYLNILLLINQL